MKPAGALFLVAVLLFAGPALAQTKPVTETITVTGRSPEAREKVLRDFARSYVAASRLTGKMARWANPICLTVIGLTPEENAAVSERIRKTARAVNAPVKDEQPCKPNAMIAFAPDAQDLMTKIAARSDLARYALGDIDGPMHARALAKLTAPIQAFYGTDTVDARHQGLSPCGANPCYALNNPGMDSSGVPSSGGEICVVLKCKVMNGSYLNNGIKSVFTTVFVVVDRSKVAGREIGAIADYAAMLTLAQTDQFATCRDMPSITNLLIPDCAANLKTTALSDADLAFLRGVYRTIPGDNLNLAMGDIFRTMEKSAAGRNVEAPAPGPDIVPVAATDSSQSPSR